MKNITKVLAAGLLFLAFASGARAEDKYEQLAREISEAGLQVQGKKIAIIPFSYADGRAGATKDGSGISERLTIKMINTHKFEIIERSVLDKVMAELKLQASGTIDASSAQQLGKVLGVEAIVTGTLVEMQAGEIEVNARLIKTETAQAIGASQISVKKDWVGDAATAQQQPQQPVYQQPQYQQPQQQVYQQAPSAQAARVRGKHEYGFFDIFMGFGSPNMKMEFTNSNRNITLSNLPLDADNDLGIDNNNIVGHKDYQSVSWNTIKTEGVGPIAFRVGGFGKQALGGDLELSFEKRNIAAQDTTWLLNGVDAGKFTFGTNDYATVKTFGISGDLLIRHAGEKVDPYFGIGLGMSLNTIELPYVKGFTDGSFVRPTNDMGLGLMFRIPVGLRIKIADKTQLVAEARYELNTIHFDRGAISGESDTITLSGVKFIVGMGFNF
jgi:TolB-like protein